MAQRSKTSEEYWREREERQRRNNITDEREYAKEINKIYQNMMDNIQKEIESFYAKYAAKEGITMAEAKKRVSQADIKAYERKAKRYVEAAARDRARYGKTKKDAEYFSDQANAEMRLYNLTMKVNRLEMLKANIGLELVNGFDELQQFFDGKLTDRTLAEFERQAGILGHSVRDNQKFAHAIVNASFHNATFSDRIWMHQDVLKAEIGKQLQIGLIQGRNPRVLAREIKKKFDVSRADAERLMITELRRVQTEAQRQSYVRNGFKQYQFHALGQKSCPNCQDLDGQVFQVKDMQPGTNAPPMHPNCRCSTSAYMDREEFDKWLDEENRKMHEADEVQRRRIGVQGQEIIDKPTYNKLTRDFLRRGGIIIRGADAERHLQAQDAYASYMTGGNFAFIRDDATVSDVLEEMYHAEQDRKGLFSSYPAEEILLRREIDAQKYLIGVAEKYKIPLEETEVTRRNLDLYEKQLKQVLKEKEAAEHE